MSQNTKKQSTFVDSKLMTRNLSLFLSLRNHLQEIKRTECLVGLSFIESEREAFNFVQFTDMKKKIEIRRLQRFQTMSVRSKNLKSLNVVHHISKFDEDKVRLEKVRKQIEFSSSSIENFIFNETQLYLKYACFY